MAKLAGMREYYTKPIKNYIWIVLAFTAIIFAMSSPWHYLHSVSGKTFFALFAPVSESVWEHLKIVFYPFLITFFAGYFVIKRWLDLDAKAYFVGATMGTLLCLWLVATNFYFFHFAFAIGNSLALDLIIEIISIFLGVCWAFHLEKRLAPCIIRTIVCACLLLTFAILFGVFAFYPPSAPLFSA